MDKYLADSNFREIKRFSHADKKGRITIGAEAKGKDYKVMINELGQILLDPVVAIPEKEAWLWKNSEAKTSVKLGLEQAAAGEVHDLGSFAQYADLDTDD